MIPWYVLIPAAMVIMFLGALGAYNFKLASTKSVHPLRIFKNYRFIIGAFFYGLAAFGYVTLLKFEDLLIIYPLAALQYVWVAFLGALLLNERMTREKFMGIGFIVLGVIIITAFK